MQSQWQSSVPGGSFLSYVTGQIGLHANLYRLLKTCHVTAPGGQGGQQHHSGHGLRVPVRQGLSGARAHRIHQHDP